MNTIVDAFHRFTVAFLVGCTLMALGTTVAAFMAGGTPPPASQLALITGPLTLYWMRRQE